MKQHSYNNMKNYILFNKESQIIVEKIIMAFQDMKLHIHKNSLIYSYKN